MIKFDSSNYKELIIRDIKQLVDIPSVISEPSENSPFGLEISNSIKKACEIAQSIGLATYIDPEGYYAYADIGQGDELVGILGHLDVVPADDVENWLNPPFEATLVGSKLYGRGTQDDKGPMVSALYALKFLKDEGYTFNKRLRFIFGTDEENLWRGITKYMEKEEKPSYGFTPDSIFPMIHAEKGLLQVKLKGKGNRDFEFVAGGAFNAVPDKAAIKSDQAKVISNLLNEQGFDHDLTAHEVTVIGKSAHAAKPHLGINAISRLSTALGKVYKSNGLKFINEQIDGTLNAENFIGEFEDVSGKFTMNLGKVAFNSDQEEICLDIRIPVTYNKEDFVKSLKDKLVAYDLEYEEFDYLEPIYVPEDNKLVQSLKEVYENVTGLDSTPLTSGGATYARAMENCVAFGAVLPGREKTEHQANEYIDVNDLMTCTEIYINAIYKLTR